MKIRKSSTHIKNSAIKLTLNSPELLKAIKELEEMGKTNKNPGFTTPYKSKNRYKSK